jgi:sugar/nucleoside kinase (ribokinase family)
MTTPIFDILGFGAVAVDDLVYVDEYPPAESKVRVRHRLRQCGGLTGTALVAAARLGASCAYVGLLGNDELSQYVTDCFAREGVDTAHCARRAGAKPAQSTIIVDEHHKTRTIFASLAGAVGADAELPSRELISSARVILVDHHGLEGTIRAARIAHENGVAIVADFERKAEGNFTDLLALIDHLVISERFAAELTGKTEPEQATTALWTTKRRAIVVTCGAAGSWLLADGFARPVHCPARAVKVLDTTGCGDVFHGAYSAALAWGKSPAECVEFASAAAALKATQRGGQTGCPTLQQVEEFLRRAE